MTYSDAQVLALKKTIRDQILDRIEEVTAEANPTYDVDGEEILWGDYLTILTRRLADIEAAIAALEPYEIHHQGYAS